MLRLAEWMIIGSHCFFIEMIFDKIFFALFYCLVLLGKNYSTQCIFCSNEKLKHFGDDVFSCSRCEVIFTTLLSQQNREQHHAVTSSLMKFF
uniref:C2H2-type domain-containing protein n=1 Tax=Rhizophora mucronata TaxID=61149 RepID=A0A2P2PK44_RHIMU